MISRSIILVLVLSFAHQAHAQHEWVVDDPDVPGIFTVATSERDDLSWWQRTLNANDWLRDGVGATFEFERSVAVVVAIGDYTHWPVLTSPAVDAERMTDFLLNSAGFDEVYTLTDREVTRDRVDELARRLRGRVGPNGRFLFYWSGHGGLLPDSQGVGFLPLPETSPDGSYIPNEPESGQFVVMRELAILGQRIGARHQLYILDACFSGSVLGEARTAARAVNLLSQPTIQLLTSSAKDEESFGVPVSVREHAGGVAGGFLTTAFLNSVGYGDATAADQDGNGFVTASEIEVSVVNELLGISAAKAISQRPDLQPLGGGKGDFFFLSPQGPKREFLENDALQELETKSVFDFPLGELRQFPGLDQQSYFFSAVSPDGNFLVTGPQAGVPDLLKWNLSTGVRSQFLLRKVANQASAFNYFGEINDVEFSNDGELLFAAIGATISIIHFDTGIEIARTPEHSTAVIAVKPLTEESFVGDFREGELTGKIVSVDYNGNGYIWELADLSKPLRFSIRNRFHTLDVAENSHEVFVNYDHGVGTLRETNHTFDGEVEVFPITNATDLHRFNMANIQVSRDGKTILAESFSDGTNIWRYNFFPITELVRECENCVALSNNGEWVLVEGFDNSLSIQSTLSGNQLANLAELPESLGRKIYFEFSDNDRCVIINSKDSVAIWRLPASLNDSGSSEPRC